jgi:hypothetical protein
MIEAAKMIQRHTKMKTWKTIAISVFTSLVIMSLLLTGFLFLPPERVFQAENGAVWIQVKGGAR